MKDKKGFTLIELLAVIVILGLLLAIAIPSITKYITESKKKTYIANVKEYISAASLAVNDMEYSIIDSNATYYLSIDCLSLEKSSKSPFGEWIDAYVVVGYNGVSYDYYWFGRDSAGYSINLVSEDDLDINLLESVKDKKIYKRELVKKNGNIYEINKENSCKLKTIYEDVEGELPIIRQTSSSDVYAFWGYKDKIKTITFENEINIPKDVLSWDVSQDNNGKVMAYISPNSDESYYDLYIQGDGRIYANENSSSLFYNFKYVDRINNINLLNTSKVKNMEYMFYYLGYSSKVFTLDLMDNFDTINVTNMKWMFGWTGYNSLEFTLELGDNFDTFNVQNMECMFYHTGQFSKIMTLDLGERFNTINVTNMGQMFNSVGYSSENFTLDLGDYFYTSRVPRMYFMFAYTGYKSKVFTLDLGDHFDTSNVWDMRAMFTNIGHANPNFTLDLGDSFYISEVTRFDSMFGSNKLKEIYLNKSSFNEEVLSWTNMFQSTVDTVVYVSTTADKSLLEANVPSNVIVEVNM